MSRFMSICADTCTGDQQTGNTLAAGNLLNCTGNDVIIEMTMPPSDLTIKREYAVGIQSMNGKSNYTDYNGTQAARSWNNSVIAMPTAAAGHSSLRFLMEALFPPIGLPDSDGNFTNVIIQASAYPIIKADVKFATSLMKELPTDKQIRIFVGCAWMSYQGYPTVQALIDPISFTWRPDVNGGGVAPFPADTVVSYGKEYTLHTETIRNTRGAENDLMFSLNLPSSFPIAGPSLYDPAAHLQGWCSMLCTGLYLIDTGTGEYQPVTDLIDYLSGQLSVMMTSSKTIII